MGELVTKGKKIIKESRFLFFFTREGFFWREIFFIIFVERHKKEGRRGFSFSRFGRSLLGRLIDIREKGC